MKYTSTRGLSPAVTAAQAMVNGIAPDGGLYLPETIPVLSDATLSAIKNRDYAFAALSVMKPFLPEFSDEELTSCIKAAYSGFEGEEPVALKKLTEDLTVLELWHGPTCAFKDMALQLFGRMLPLCKQKCGRTEETLILTATSGDTGKAALEGFRDVPGIRIVVFYPHGGVSRIQELQMTTQMGENVGVYAVRGNFDDAQTGVKRLFADEDLRAALQDKNVRLSSANSINWGRLLPQIVYYVYASVCVSDGRSVDFAVPTGNFGNILAGYLAKKMGAPIGRLLCASNKNRVLTDFFETGVYDRRRPFYKTNSPSMDILISSNLERLLCLETGDREKVRALMTALQNDGCYRIDAALLSSLRQTFDVAAAGDVGALAAIAYAEKTYGYLMDPHTAVAYAALGERPLRAGFPTVLVSTASPYKFAPAVLKALGQTGDGFDALSRLSACTKTTVPASLSILRTLPVRFDAVVETDEMKNVLTFD